MVWLLAVCNAHFPAHPHTRANQTTARRPIAMIGDLTTANGDSSSPDAAHARDLQQATPPGHRTFSIRDVTSYNSAAGVLSPAAVVSEVNNPNPFSLGLQQKLVTTTSPTPLPPLTFGGGGRSGGGGGGGGGDREGGRAGAPSSPTDESPQRRPSSPPSPRQVRRRKQLISRRYLLRPRGWRTLRRRERVT